MGTGGASRELLIRYVGVILNGACGLYEVHPAWAVPQGQLGCQRRPIQDGGYIYEVGDPMGPIVGGEAWL